MGNSRVLGPLGGGHDHETALIRILLFLSVHGNLPSPGPGPSLNTGAPVRLAGNRGPYRAIELSIVVSCLYLTRFNQRINVLLSSFQVHVVIGLLEVS